MLKDRRVCAFFPLLFICGCSTIATDPGFTQAPGQMHSPTLTTSPSHPLSLVNIGGTTPPQNPKDLPIFCANGTLYRPIPPISVTNYTEISLTDENGKTVVTSSKKMFDLTDQEKVNKELPNIASAINKEEINIASNVAIFSAEVKNYKITIDFAKYRTEPINDSSGNYLLYGRVGAGLRLTAFISTRDASLDAGNLLSIAASVRAGKTKGTLTTDVMGMDAPDITGAIPFTADLSEASIQRAIEALAIIKAKLHETNTTLRPQLIAAIECKT